MGFRVIAVFIAALINTHALTDAFGESAYRWTEADDKSVAAKVRAEIDAGRIPGAVILIGTKNKIFHRAAYGNKKLEPEAEPMTVDTVFDLASVTKVVAATTSVMQLVEQKKLALTERVARYWPEFVKDGKNQITLQHLLTHYSGLRPDLDLKTEWSGYDTAMKLILDEKPKDKPGARYIYSDINFEILGELVRRVTKTELNEYCSENVFGPLKMTDTRFRPPLESRNRIAPTRDLPDGSFWGEVHDPSARRMGGVAGHAGLFSTADDLSVYARMLLNGGTDNGTRILNPKTIQLMTMRQSPAHGPRARGYGWDLGGPDGYKKAPKGTYGHFGFTGTMIWIDPAMQVYAVVLTNRVYFEQSGEADPLRQAIIALIADPSHRQVDR